MAAGHLNGMDVLLRRGERRLVVTLSESGDARATVDGAPHDLQQLVLGPRLHTSDGWVVEELAFVVDERPIRATVARRPDRLLVAIGGRVFDFGIGDAMPAGALHAGSGLVVAPMPGKIVQVLVGPGEVVEAGQPVVILEAMKMETTLAAEIAGRIEAVQAVPGAMVEGGALLVEIAPA